MRVRAFRTVGLPVEEVWATLSDHEGMSHWSPGVKVTLEHPGSPEPGGVGAVRRVKGPGAKIREEVIAYEPGRRLAYRALSGIPLRGYAGEVTLAPDGAATRVTWVLECAHRAVVIRVLLGAFARIFLNAMLRAARRHSRRKRVSR